MSIGDPLGPHLLIIGNVNVDIVIGPVADWPVIGTETVTERGEFRVGGSAGNAALTMQGLKKRCLLVAGIGSDPLGAWLAGTFDTGQSRLHTEPGPTTFSVGITHAGGERTFLTSPGHLAALDPAALVPLLPHNAAAGSIALVCGVFLSPRLVSGLDTLLDALHQRGYQVALDTGWPDATGWTEELKATVRGWLPRTDQLLLNEVELKGLAGRERIDDAIADLLPHLPRDATLVAKLGPAGVTVRRAGQRLDLPAPAVEVIDTVGAGDTFNAAYLATLLDGEPLEDALRAGVETAAAAISTFPRRYTLPISPDSKVKSEV